MNFDFNEFTFSLRGLLDTDPSEAIKQAQCINIPEDNRLSVQLKVLKGSILVDGGKITCQIEVIQEGLTLFYEVYTKCSTGNNAYNLGNGISAIVCSSPHNDQWLDHQEQTREDRAKARQYFWEAVKKDDIDNELKTRILTNMGNELSASYRYGEAHDAWFFALKTDPRNGVAAYCAAQSLLWLHSHGCISDATFKQIARLAQMIRINHDQVVSYTGAQAAEKILDFAQK